ncbi:ABC transporter substrate-binding protein [Vibrio ulleungensis]|uniref:Extracellular solute-binding protein n=1 Tax=Vibrio ulleungensis TaxID=2807619 RepID=A0ABS2HQ98_9VIBR|nr:extracellular solute-binding protein [Vibrio ulleungensis]MBM7038393.1 extracellular solute-binding protein [Vibrio ulleungensis]
MKKQMVKGLVASAVTLACLGNTAFAGDVKVWAWDPNFNVAIMEKAAEQFEANHSGTDIQVIESAKADIEQKLHIMLASGQTSELPDIVLIEDYNAQKYLLSYPGAFEPLTGKVDHSQFAPYKVDTATVGGEVYSVPFDTGATGFYYRTDILAEAGFSAADLENITWDRFIEIGKVVKEKTGVSFAVYDPSDMGLVRVMLQSAGSWYFNEDGSLNIQGNKALAESLETYAELFTSGITRPNSGWGEWVGAINSGRAATITTGVWITGSVKAAPDQAGKWAVAPTPRLNIEGSRNASNLGGSSWYVLSSSKNKDEAISFLKETYTDNAGFYDEILQERGAVGSYVESAKSPGYAAEQEFFGGQKVFADFSKWAADIPSVNYGLYTYEVDAALAAQLPAIMNGAEVEPLLNVVHQELKYSLE